MKNAALVLIGLLAVMAGCQSAPTATPVLPAPPAAIQPTATLVPPTPMATVPTSMPVPPTSTAIPVPTATPTDNRKFNLSGVVFHDHNGNGIRDETEPIVENAVVRVGKLTATSGPDGQYALREVPQGTQEIVLSAEGFHFVAHSVQAFQLLYSPALLAINSDTKRDWGLMVGFLTHAFRCEDVTKLRIGYFDLDYQVGYIRIYTNKSCPTETALACNTYDNHAGIDWYGSTGIPIVAMAPGIVIDTSTVSSGAIRVQVSHDALGRRFVTDYGHNQENLVRVGQKVERGQVIALSGTSGTNNPHLHWNFWEIPGWVQTGRDLYSFLLAGTMYPRMWVPSHQYDVPAVLDPFRDLANSSTVSYWTRDNDPQCLSGPSDAKKPLPSIYADLEIAPDGMSSDWKTRQSILISPGNLNAQKAGGDLSAAFALTDSKNLYLRLDQHGGFPNPPLQAMIYTFELRSAEWGDRVYQINIQIVDKRIQVVPLDKGTPNFQEQKSYDSAAISQVLEAKIPLEVFRNPTEIEITAYTHLGRALVKRMSSVVVSLKP